MNLNLPEDDEELARQFQAEFGDEEDLQAFREWSGDEHTTPTDPEDAIILRILSTDPDVQAADERWDREWLIHKQEELARRREREQERRKRLADKQERRRQWHLLLRRRCEIRCARYKRWLARCGIQASSEVTWRSFWPTRGLAPEQQIKYVPEDKRAIRASWCVACRHFDEKRMIPINPWGDLSELKQSPCRLGHEPVWRYTVSHADFRAGRWGYTRTCLDFVPEVVLPPHLRSRPDKVLPPIAWEVVEKIGLIEGPETLQMYRLAHRKGPLPAPAARALPALSALPSPADCASSAPARPGDPGAEPR